MATESERESWYDSRIGRVLYWGLIVATLVAVVLSSTTVLGTTPAIPPGVYLFGFLGATVYAFTSFAKRFDESGRYRLKVFSRTVAALPLAAGVYLLAFAFTGFDGGAGAADGAQGVSGDRAVAGLVFLAGLYVSTALQALGGIADRLLGGGGADLEAGGTPGPNGGDRSEGDSGATDDRETGAGAGDDESSVG
ncbi:hypothetical protein [Halorubrum sp. Boch-26]|uniref:hypothetical protein n=1 Tax=Halorubrum sp. Boch-26 TaxID=2994426 RepID=UPI002468AB89|nr:hypothetical protein [Halorubrum sp. Boch-26]